MFIAVELSDERGFRPNCRPAWFLVHEFRSVEALPIFQQAFPDGDSGFMTAFEKVLRLEDVRMSSRRSRSDPDSYLHDPCFDAQSFWWCILWGLAGALPAGRNSRSDMFDNMFDSFRDCMLEHRIGGRDGRLLYLAFSEYEPLLHRDLHYLDDLLIDMATYVCTPWHLYKNNEDIDLHPCHAHHAMRRLLFGAINNMTTAAPEYNIKLNARLSRMNFNLATEATEPPTRSAHPSGTTCQKRTADNAGLVNPSRPTKRSRAPPEPWYNPPDPKSTTRVKELLHLASLGDQCEAVIQLLVDDATESTHLFPPSTSVTNPLAAHLQMLYLGVIRRDLSWYNILWSVTLHFIPINLTFLQQPCSSPGHAGHKTREGGCSVHRLHPVSTVVEMVILP